jgi:thiosulfate/3-mercaptopyruvate sulfurtransferase
MFRAFGHDKSSILNGGLPRWEAEGFPVERKPPVQTKKSQYPTPKFDGETIRSEKKKINCYSVPLITVVPGYEQIVSNSCLNPPVDSRAELVVDARSRGRCV